MGRTNIMTKKSNTLVADFNDVNFYDYDGTIVYSYTAEEFKNLTALPNNPTHKGLTAQGWNWSLSDAKTYVATYGKLNIGQMYITDDGKTRIYITLRDGRLSPCLGICVNGSVEVDWGDDSVPDTVTGTSLNTNKNTQHIYAHEGDYVIKISSSNGSSFAIKGLSSYGSYLLWNNATSQDYDNLSYLSSIQKIELGQGISRLYEYALNKCYSLSSITIPNNINNFGDGVFDYCYSLKSITFPDRFSSIYSVSYFFKFNECHSLSSNALPDNLNNIPTNAYYNCYSLSNITIPSSVKKINNRAFMGCHSLKSITIPSDVSEIAREAFSGCYSVAYYDFSNHTSVPTLSNTNAFTGIASDCKIIVPDSLYSAWIAATNWSTYSSYIVKASEV